MAERKHKTHVCQWNIRETLVASRSELLSGFGAYVDRLLADLAQVNWGPKAGQP